MTPLLAIWYTAGLFIIALVAVDTRRRARTEGLNWRRFAFTTAIPLILGSTLFAIWPLVAWAMARGL